MSDDAAWPPLGFALSFVLAFSAVFEPVRNVLLHGQTRMAVGGVGGVGGLANLGVPSEDCATQPHEGKYCYVKGSVGPFMGFAWLTLCCWVGPWLVACAVQSFGSSKPSTTTALSSRDAAARTAGLAWIYPVWMGLNLLWFSVPFAVFGLGLQEIKGPFARQVLAVALAASHPLSWNLALVVIPVGGIIPRLLSTDDNAGKGWFEFHRLLGYTTAFWALLHGCCELLYLVTSKKRFRESLDIRNNGENLIYWAGILCLVVMVAHVVAAYYRRRCLTKPVFQRIHRLLAGLLLLVAACHWWPFALLFVPATAVEGVALASRFAPSVNNGDRPPVVARLSPQQAATALQLSLVGSLAGLYGVWAWREKYMLSPRQAYLYGAFFFPPFSVLTSLALSVLVTWLYFAYLSDQGLLVDRAIHSVEEEPSTESDGDVVVDDATTPLLAYNEI